MSHPGQALFFTPVGVIGDMIGEEIGQVIGSYTSTKSSPEASQSPKTPLTNSAAGSHGITDKNGTNLNSTTLTAAIEQAGGGEKTNSRKRGREVLPAVRSTSATTKIENSSEAASVAPAATVDAPDKQPEDTASAARLRTFGVRADVAALLADRPLAQVERIIAQAQARQDIRDRAGWVVAALRMLPASEPPAPPAPVNESAILFHPTISGYERQQWLGRFRRAEPADRPEILKRFHAAHPLEYADGATA
jgi:hypothetical protein